MLTIPPARKNSRTAILMPVYQGQEDFRQTIHSLHAFDCPCDVVVIDDGSSPTLSLDGIDQRGLNVILLHLDRNQGIVGAMNAGLEAILDAGYEFIARLDAGDYPIHSRWTKQIEYLDSHQACALVTSNVIFQNEAGEYLFTLEPPVDAAALRRALHERAWIMHPSVLFRASLIRELGPYTNRYPAAEDYELFMRINRRHELGVIPEPLLIYVVRSGGISGRRSMVQALSRLRIQIRYFDFCHTTSYYGVFRTVTTMLLPVKLKSVLKSRWLYRRPTA